MQILKGIVLFVLTTIVVLVFTFICLRVRTNIEIPGVAAIGLDLVRMWTIYSPIYWILLAPILFAAYKLFRFWTITPKP